MGVASCDKSPFSSGTCAECCLPARGLYTAAVNSANTANSSTAASASMYEYKIRNIPAPLLVRCCRIALSLCCCGYLVHRCCRQVSGRNRFLGLLQSAPIHHQTKVAFEQCKLNKTASTQAQAYLGGAPSLFSPSTLMVAAALIGPPTRHRHARECDGRDSRCNDSANRYGCPCWRTATNKRTEANPRVSATSKAPSNARLRVRIAVPLAAPPAKHDHTEQ